jgi:hypothetical protein
MVADLVSLAGDEDWLVSQRSLDLLEKLSHDHTEWIEPHKQIFVSRLAESDKWEVRLQIVRALPLFRWELGELRRVKAILRENVSHPQTFVKAWALDSLATLAEKDPKLRPVVRSALISFERSKSKALQARARKIRERVKWDGLRV